MTSETKLASLPQGKAPWPEEEIRRARRRFQLGEEATVVSCYEAGRDGFWIHRFLESIGVNSAWLYVMEFFGWREFRNRREVGGLAGLAPTPSQSGEQALEQGIDRAGNRHVRAMAIKIAWGWLRFQPESALSQLSRSWTAGKQGTEAGTCRNFGGFRGKVP